MSDLTSVNVPMNVIREAVAVAVQNSRDARAIVVRPASVVNVSADQRIAELHTDDGSITDDDTSGGDDVSLEGVAGAQIICSSVRSGDRVMVMYVPPHAAFVIGRLSGDYDEWHYVGDDNEPPFASNWGNSANTGEPGTANNSHVAFTRIGRHIQLQGQATRTADIATLSTIFTLPDQYHPNNVLSFPTLSGPLGAPNALIQVTVDGDVQVLNFAGAVGGAGGFVELDVVSFVAAIDPTAS